VQILSTGILNIKFAEMPARRSLAERKILGIAKWRAVAEDLQAEGEAGNENSDEIVRYTDEHFFSKYNLFTESLQLILTDCVAGALRYTIKTTARKSPVHNQRTVVYGNVLVLKRGVVAAATKTWKITEGVLKEMYDKRKKILGGQT
jgi:hypothetical protein